MKWKLFWPRRSIPMIRENFGALVQLPARVDVNESKLKQLLSDRPRLKARIGRTLGTGSAWDQQHAEKGCRKDHCPADHGKTVAEGGGIQATTSP